MGRLKLPLKFILAIVPPLIRRAKWRAKHPGPVDFVPTKDQPRWDSPAVAQPTPLAPTTPMKFSPVAVFALIAALCSALLSPEVAPFLTPAVKTVVSAFAAILAAFTPKVVETQKQ